MDGMANFDLVTAKKFLANYTKQNVKLRNKTKNVIKRRTIMRNRKPAHLMFQRNPTPIDLDGKSKVVCRNRPLSSVSILLSNELKLPGLSPGQARVLDLCG